MEKKELNSFLGHDISDAEQFACEEKDCLLKNKIVIYDSGIGGESIFKKTKKISNNTFYFMDSDHFPYGTKTFEELKKIFLANLNILNLKSGDLLVLACNTISCVYLQLKKEMVLNYNVISILDLVMNKKDALVICTQYTSQYLNDIGIKNKSLSELAYLIEKNDKNAIALYLQNQRLEENKIIYGCTHYPVIDRMFREIYSGKEFVNPEEELMQNIKAWIERQS